jgi:hypothetical protein
MELAKRRIIWREANVVRVDFQREPDPPAPRFPGAGALRMRGYAEELLEYPAARGLAICTKPEVLHDELRWAG